MRLPKTLLPYSKDLHHLQFLYQIQEEPSRYQAPVFKYWDREGLMLVQGNGNPFYGEMKDIISSPTNNNGGKSCC